MSQASAISRPPASAQPFTAAIVGLYVRCSPRVSPPSPVATLSRTFRGVASSIHGGMKVLRSAPAEKESPVPVRIATSTASSEAKSSQVLQRSSCVSGSIAFLASGRLIVT